MRAGHGGRGSASFRREPFVPRGGPDGGDGGRGGSVLIKATTGVADLSLYKRKLRWQAEPGANGAGGLRGLNVLVTAGGTREPLQNHWRHLK